MQIKPIKPILVSLRVMIGQRATEVHRALGLLSPAGRRQFFQAVETFKELLQAVYVEGGLTVATGTPQAPDGSAPVIRTVIQGDGDILSFLTPHCFERPELWQHHLVVLRQELKRLQRRVARLEATLCGLATLLSPLPIICLYGIWNTGLAGWLQTLLHLVAWSLLFAILRMLIQSLGLSWIRRKLPLS